MKSRKGMKNKKKAALTVMTSMAVVLSMGITVGMLSLRNDSRVTSVEAEKQSASATATGVSSITAPVNTKKQADVSSAREIIMIADEPAKTSTTPTQGSENLNSATVAATSNAAASTPAAPVTTPATAPSLPSNIPSTSFNTTSGKVNFSYSFVKDGNDTYLYVDGKMQTGLIKFNNEDLYYFDTTTGKMYMGWLKVGETIFYFAPPSGIAVKDGFFMIDGQKYNFNNQGAMMEGFRTVDDDKYFMDPAAGGAIQYGFQEVGGNLYYVNPGSGILETGWFDVGGKTYYASSGGVVARNMKKVCEKKRSTGTYEAKFLFGPDGALQTGFVWEGSNLYYYDSEYGLIEEGGPGTYNGGWFDSEAGWIYAQDNGKLYYNKTEELPLTRKDQAKYDRGEITVTKKNYSFDANGILDE